MSTDQPARNAVATRSILMSASSVCLLASLLTPAFAIPSADCQWGSDDPAAVVQSCTAQLSVEKAPAAWMYFNRGLAFKVLGKLDEAHRDYSKSHRARPVIRSGVRQPRQRSNHPQQCQRRHGRFPKSTCARPERRRDPRELRGDRSGAQKSRRRQI